MMVFDAELGVSFTTRWPRWLAYVVSIWLAPMFRTYHLDNRDGRVILHTIPRFPDVETRRFYRELVRDCRRAEGQDHESLAVLDRIERDLRRS